MAKLTEKQKQKARGIREVRRSERRLNRKGSETTVAPAKRTPAKPKPKGIRSVLKGRSNQIDKAVRKATGR